jgi:hypothetical protein
MGQSKITRRCDGLMRKNGEQDVIDFACAESRHFVCGKLLSFVELVQYALETIGLLRSMRGYSAYGVSVHALLDCQ